MYKKGLLKLFEVTFFALFFCLSIVFCNSKESGNDYKFTDQDLQGKIGGNPWTYLSGYAEDGYEVDTMSIKIFALNPDGGDACGTLAYPGNPVTVMFTFDKAVGLEVLGPTTKTVTLYDGSMNYITTKGAVEILTLDYTTAMEVTGRIDADFNGDNSVNGNFTIKWCP